MKQINRESILNAYNQGNALVNYKDYHTWFFTTNNGNIMIPVLSNRNKAISTYSSCCVDSYNNAYSFYKQLPNKKVNFSKSAFFYFFEKLFLFFWKRVVFRGKSFRVRVLKQHKKLVLNFGYSHWTRLLFFKPWNFFKKRRQSYIVYSNNLVCFLSFLRFFPTIKPINHYTLRGLRFKQQGLAKRFGKVSQHTSIF